MHDPGVLDMTMLFSRNATLRRIAFLAGIVMLMLSVGTSGVMAAAPSPAAAAPAGSQAPAGAAPAASPAPAPAGPPAPAARRSSGIPGTGRGRLTGTGPGGTSGQAKRVTQLLGRRRTKGDAESRHPTGSQEGWSPSAWAQGRGVGRPASAQLRHDLRPLCQGRQYLGARADTGNAPYSPA